jgi:hypothetical protein
VIFAFARRYDVNEVHDVDIETKFRQWLPEVQW